MKRAPAHLQRRFAMATGLSCREVAEADEAADYERRYRRCAQCDAKLAGTVDHDDGCPRAPKLQQPATPPAAAYEPPAVVSVRTHEPATAGGAPLPRETHDQWIRSIAWECWINSDFDIERAANLAARETEDEAEYREICAALHDIERAQDAEGYE